MVRSDTGQEYDTILLIITCNINGVVYSLSLMGKTKAGISFRLTLPFLCKHIKCDNRVIGN